MHIDKKTIRNLVIGAAACVFLYWLLHETDRVRAVFGAIKNLVSPFVIGACMAFILNVPMRSFENLLKGVKSNKLRRVLAICLTFIAVLLVLAIVFVLLIPQLVETIRSLVPKVYNFFVNLEKYAVDFVNNNQALISWGAQNAKLESLNWANIVEQTMNLLGDSVERIISGAFSALGSVAGALVDAVIAVVFALYCLFQKETLARQGRKLLYAYLPENVADGIVKVFRLTNTTFSNFLSGQCIEVCILGCLFAIAMAIFRMPYIPLVSVLVAVTAFVPVVGAWIGCVLGAFFIFVSNPMQAVWFIILFVVLQQIENNMIYPRVVGTSIGLSGMWVLVAITLGGELMGVVGMFLMIPLTSVIYTVLREYTNIRLACVGVDPEKLKEQPPELRSKFKEMRNKKRNLKKEKAPENSENNQK